MARSTQVLGAAQVALMYKRSSKLAAEFVGTFGLVLFSSGAVCADQFLRNTNQGDLGVLGIALAYGLAAGGLFSAIGHISGGHFNPAVTIGFWVTRRQGTFDTLSYWIAQLAGATAASYILRYAIPFDVWSAVALGTPGLASGLMRGPAMLIEGMTTFLLVLALFAALVDRRLGMLGGPAIAFVIAAGAILGGPFTGGAMNPARAFGPALAAAHWTNQGVYWIGPFAGAIIAAYLYDLLFLDNSSQPPASARLDS